MKKLIILIHLLYFINKFAYCFISSFSGPFILIYSIIRTIDGMTENIQHISNSMDLSLQSFLSSQLLSENTDKFHNTLVIGADYHGSASPCGLAFHPTISNGNFTKRDFEVENNDFPEIKSYIGSPLMNFETIPLIKSGNDTENIIEYGNIKGLNNDLKNKLGEEVNLKENLNTLLEPFNYNTKMVSTEFKDNIVNNYLSDYILTAKIFDPIQGGNIYNGNSNTLNVRTGSGGSIYRNEIPQNNPYETRYQENNGFDIDSFRVYTYYTTHYLFQITGILSMGISMHSQYRRKSRQRKLHLVR